MTLTERSNTPIDIFNHYLQTIHVYDEIQLCKQALNKMKETEDLKDYEKVLMAMEDLIEEFLTIAH